MKNILKSKTVKFLVIFFLVTIYCNIGWWYGKAFYGAQTKYVCKQPLNGFEKAITGGWQFLAKDTDLKLVKNRYPFVKQIIYVLFWPLVLVVPIISWIAYVVVWLFKFVFGGGFFRIIGSVF